MSKKIMMICVAVGCAFLLNACTVRHEYQAPKPPPPGQVKHGPKKPHKFDGPIYVIQQPSHPAPPPKPDRRHR